VRLHLGLPRQFGAARRAILRQANQVAQALVERVRQGQLHVLQQFVVALHDGLRRLHPLRATGLPAQLTERISDAGQRGNHDQYPGPLGAAARHQLADVLPARQGGHAGAAELHHDPGSVRGQRRGGWRGHEGSLSGERYSVSVALRHLNCKWL